MTNPIVQLRRKNEGTIFTVADAGTRQIIHWHRPGEVLPFFLWYKDRDYEVTAEDIQQATLKGRVVLEPLDEFYGPHPKSGVWPKNWDVNGKGYAFAVPEPTRWQRFKAWVAKQINKLKGVFK